MRHSNVPTVFLMSPKGLLLSCGGWSFPSHSSSAQMMSDSAHHALWYSFPKDHGLQGTNMNPGHVYSFTHSLMDSSIQFIQLGKNIFAMFLLQQSNISQTSQNLSLYSGGSLFVHVRLLRIFSKQVHVM